MAIKKADSVWLYNMLDELLKPGYRIIIYRRMAGGGIIVHYGETNILRRKKAERTEGKTIKEAMRKMYVSHCPRAISSLLLLKT